MKRVLITIAGALLLASISAAQTQPEVTYADDFQSYGTPADPPGWVDNPIGVPHREADGLFKTWPDPLKPGNVVFGTKQASGQPDGNTPRIGSFTTLTTRAFAGKGRFEYRGRFLRTTAEARIGLSFFSSYTEVDRYYLIGLWSRPPGGLSLQLFGFGAGALTGTVDSGLTLDPNVWYRFLVQVDDVDDTTKIRARFWADGTAEPSTFSIDATDTAAGRLRDGKIGLWAAVRGDAYIDDIFAKSPVDHTPPDIRVFESGNSLADGSKFNRDAVPEIRVTDDLSTFTYTAALDGQPYASLTPVTTEAWHTLAIHAVDGPGNASDLSLKFLVDKTPPHVVILEGTLPFPTGAFFNRDVVAQASVTDISQTTVTALLDGQPYTLGTPITAEASHAIAVTAVDEAGWPTTAGPLPFVIDKTKPQLTFTSHHDGDVLDVAHAVLAGGADDAVTVMVAGTAATVDAAAKTFTTSDLPLLEGENAILVTGTDKAGNVGTATLKLFVDTRPPALTIATPAADACLDTTSLQVTGAVTDPHVASVKVTIGATTVAATLDAAAGTWTASVPVADEGKKLVTVEAADTKGHTASLSRSVIIDRTPPVIEVRENGDDFTGGAKKRALTMFVRATDADASVAVSAKLDGAAFVSGTPVDVEGPHTLAVTASDCAGHTSQKSVEFSIDLTAPSIRNLVPPNGTTVGTMPSTIAGATDTDVVTVEVAGTALRATPEANGNFTIAAVPFEEGSNQFTLTATDRAGNAGSAGYNVTVKTTAPVVEIRESGSPIPAGALFNRAITTLIRSVEPQATIAATLNGAAFTSGTTISADGAYTLHATATDAFGHVGSADATFSIDRTPPAVKITAPAAGTLQADHAEVRGTAGDSVSANLNGQPLTLAADGSFVADSPLDVGVNALVVSGRDRAGNVGRDEVLVTRDDLAAGLLVTYPPDRSRTNRPATDVIGRLLTPGRDTIVKVGSTTVSVDPTGLFRVSGYPLVEGENTITVTAIATNGMQSSVSTHVTADFTPPAVTILESGQALTDGARFPERAVISLQASDAGGGTVVTELTIDGTATATSPFTITATGGHSIVGVARDLAGNETRAERTLFIGAASAAGCALDSFDPHDGAVILANKTELVGRSGGAVGVKVNGVAAIVADGAFCASVELPAEGPNTVTIVCTDANGNPTGTPQTITLQRVTGNPSITIDAPAEGFVSAQESMGVTGTVGAGVITADVNGVAATITGSDSSVPRPFSVTGVHLADGLNILVAHGRNAGGRIATASRRGMYLKDAPAISISSPAAGAVTGIPKVTVSGTFSDLDPATVVVSNLALSGQSTPAQTVRYSDTTGSFNAVDVALTAGDQTLRVSGRDRLNREATAAITIRLTSGTPGITIAQPVDHAVFGPGNDSFSVTGTFQAATGAIVDVNGVTATLSGSSYTASCKFSTLSGGITPVVARVTQPDGASASSAIIVTQLTDAPRVVESFPAADAVEVDTGALLLVLFSQPIDVSTLNGAFRLEDSAGAPVSGSLFLDQDVLTFAPATSLTPGARHTIRVSTAAKNLAGTPLAADFASTFTAATTAPATAPMVNPLGSAVCGQSITVAGTAAPSARVRLETGTLILNATSDATGKFSFNYPLSGQSGFAVIRVSVVGSDGSVSPAAELKVRIDCSGPQVLNAGYDRTVNKLTIQFSEPINPATATVGSGNALVLTLDDGRVVGGSASVAQSTVTLTPAEDLSAKSFTLGVSTAVKDTIGNPLVAPYSQVFSAGGDQPAAGDGSGFISGEVYDATTGRPLAGVAVSIEVPSAPAVTTATDARGRYLARLREGAHTIKAVLAGYTTVWREIIVPAGAGAIPIDMRLTRRGDAKTSEGSAIAITHGGDTAITRKIDLSVPSGALAGGHAVALTAIGAQALTGLLPLGWSPIAAGEVVVDASDVAAALPGAQLTFYVPAAAITAAAQNLTAVQYNAARDEWRVNDAVVNVGSDGKVTLPIASSGAYALVYPDKAAGLTAPPLPTAGDVLRGVPAAPEDGPALVKRDFQLDPPVVLPSGRTVATLRIEGSGASFPSGTAVQAYIDEELRLADGSRLLDPPFATDLLLYRSLTGDLGVADFHLAPSPKAAEVILEVGVDHIRVMPYPGRLDRGTLIGPEGGRVPADDKVSIDIATGAVSEPIRASAVSLTSSDLTAIGSISGFRVAGGFQLTLQRATEPAPVDLDGDGSPDPVAAPELFIPARATVTVETAKLPSPTAQVILGELLDQTPYGRMVRLVVPMMLVDPTQTSTPALRFTTKSIDRAVLPVDGVAHEGRYVVLAAEAPIAFATGTVRNGGAQGRFLADARVLAAPLGVLELTRATGIYNIPVPAKPAGPFTLAPRHTSTGEGAVYTHASAVDPDAVIRVDLALVAQPPVLGPVVVLKGEPPSQATLSRGTTTDNVSLTTNVRASFTPSIDPASVTADSILVTESSTGAKVNGKAAADGSVGVVWTLTPGERLKPNGRYSVTISPTIRGANGAALGQSTTYMFATVTEILNSEIHRERIRITIPDANGVSRIIGLAGALPAGWQTVAVRRHHDFLVRYQATAAADGSFSFAIGNGGDPSDKVTIADLIDLQVISNIGNLAAIFSLTPFTSEDGKSFVVPAGVAVRFTTPENITLNVPAGAFDEPTVVTVTAAKKEEFLDIPSLELENEYVGSARVDFQGVAKKPLGLEVPIPQGFDTTDKIFLLAEKGMSPVGPRLAMLDLMRVDNGKLITDHENTNLSAVHLGAGLKPGTSQTLTGSRFTKYLQMLMRSGIFMALDIKVYGVGGSVGFGVMESLQTQYDLIWDIYASYYIPHIYVSERGGALMPIITGRRFTVTGFDPGTGLQATQKTYDPIASGPPGTVTPMQSPDQNDSGPYPVFGSPFRVETLDLEVEEVDIRSIRNFNIRLENGTVTVAPGIPALEADVDVTLLNVSKGQMIRGTAASTMQLSAVPGNRIALIIEEHRVDSRSALSVVFNEPVYIGGSSGPADIDDFLHDLIKVEHAGSDGNFTDITPHVHFATDSGNRRVNIELPSALQSEAQYRITLKPGIADVVDDAPGMKLGEGTIENPPGVFTPVGGGEEIQLLFDVRAPEGALNEFTAAPNGLIRGMDLSGNVLIVAAWDGGLRSYDVSNPVTNPPVLGFLGSLSETGSSHLSVTIDRHNRVYTTVQQPASGAFRSYRVEDFVRGGTPPIVGSKLINWRIGLSQDLGLPSNTMLSDIPESIPFRIKVLLQDDEQNFKDRQEFLNTVGASQTGDYPKDDLKKYTATISGTGEYKVQRITVENVSLDMRWSADALDGGSATIENIVARSTDKMRVIKNLRTYAIVAHLGYGIGIYDANAIESNTHLRLPKTNPNHIREQLVLTAGLIDRYTCPNPTPDFGIIENYITTDAELGGGDGGNVYSYSTDTYHGILDLNLSLPSAGNGYFGTQDDDCGQRPDPNTGGLLFQPPGHEVPRIAALRAAIPGSPFGHFGHLARYHWSITAEQNKFGTRGIARGNAGERDYLLVAGNQYGLIVVDIESDPDLVGRWPLIDDNVADVIWIPGGAVTVRVYQSANIAVVSDRYGRVLVVDLSRIDERWNEKNEWIPGLFPTVAKCLAGAADGPGVGADDPRILWKSEPGVAMGAAAPVFDPLTGMVFAGNLLKVKALSAVDPRVQMKVNLGEPGGLSEVGGVVPLGVPIPPDIQSRIDALPACDGTTLACKDNASLGAFKLEVTLPGNMVDELTQSGNELRLAVESERIAGAVTEQTPDGFPYAHLRRMRRDGTADPRAANNFKFKRVVPEELRGVLKSQRGYNRFVSPWIIAIADPRSSEKYNWRDASTKQQKKDAGCDECERPKFLKTKTEDDDVFELWTNGRYIAVRPELTGADNSIFNGTRYQYLGVQDRLLGRFATVIADTVRPTETLVAGQNPPLAAGALQETTFMHSGEIEESTVDLNAGGRAGFDVVYDRTYRSRTLGGSVFGQGWDSSLLRRLRALPNGDVEYRDGSEVWRFRLVGGEYESPKGLFLKLTRTARGWKMIDQSWRVAEFDDLGRLLSEADEFFDPQTPDSGNIIRYLYDEKGRLSQVVDPVKRETKLTYFEETEAGADGAYPGMVKKVVDWRDRTIEYVYDPAAGTLKRVKLPEVRNTTGSRPAVEYAYLALGGNYTDNLELRTDLESIKEPQEVAAGGSPRVKFTYDTGSGFTRDHVLTQLWGTGENATFTYNSRTSATLTDVLGQTRDYTMNAEPPKDSFSDRPHVASQVEKSVTISSAPFGELPATISAGAPPTTTAERTMTFTYDDQGQVLTETLAGVRSKSFTYIDVRPAAPGFVPAGPTVTPLGGPGSPVTQRIAYQSGPNRNTFIQSFSANGLTVEAPQPSRSNRNPSASNDSMNANQTFDITGQMTKLASSGGTDGESAGGDTSITYAGSGAAKHERGMVTSIQDGGLTTSIRHASADMSVETDPRGITTTIEYDTWQRPIHVTVAGPQLTVDESFDYDANGRLVKHVRKQGEVSVTKTYAYDVMNRPTVTTQDNIADAGTLQRTISYNLAGRTITTTHPSGAVTTTTLDTLGRIVRRETTTGGSPIIDSFAYDLAGNVVFSSDQFAASATAFDAYGGIVGTMALDGTKTTATLDAWRRPTSIKSLDSAGKSITEATLDFAAAGHLRSGVMKLDADRTRSINMVWDGAGRTTGVGASGRAARTTYDAARRLKTASVGAGTAAAIDTPVERTEATGYTGGLVQKATKQEKTGAYQVALEYNTIGAATTQDLGNLEWRQSFDQAGNVTSSSDPSRPAFGYQYDSRGAVRRELLPSGGSNDFTYHPTGALASYKDPSNEITSTTNDLIGRPIRRLYKDGTEEKVEWEGRRVKSITDRQRRVQNFIYNERGQISAIHGADGIALDKIEYDEAGRITKWTTPDAVIEYSDFDAEGKPKRTVQSRVSGGSVIDRYTQEHTWDVHGERIAWTMPAYDGFNSLNGWTQSLRLERDAAGNITKIERTLLGGLTSATLLTADYRNADRPDKRTVTTPGSVSILREYRYDASNGLMNRMAAIVKGKTIAGSEILYDGLQKAKARLLGVSGGSRGDEWSYDERSRLRGSILARDGGSTPNSEDLTAGDFRNSLDRQRTTPADPPSIVFKEDPNGGHKLSVVQRGLTIEEFKFDGGERREDGRFTYEYDAKGRLSAARLKTDATMGIPRRVRYFYDGRDRLVGRRLEYAPVPIGIEPRPEDWKLEDRPEILGRETLPADATLVWDAVDDQLVAIFKAGASNDPLIDANGGLVRQFVHGGMRYDDPLEVAVPDSYASAGVSRLYPIYDEAGSKSLQIILNEKGEIVSRSVAAGPYGEDQAILVGPAVDKVRVVARKDAGGKIVGIDFIIRSTEDIAETTVAAGFRVAAVDSSGKVVGTSSATATLADSATAKFTLTESEWTTLSSGGVAISIGTTNSARGDGWNATTGFLPAPGWARETKPVFTSAELPVEVRESLSGLSAWLASIPADTESTNTLYEVPTLYALGIPRIVDGVAAFPAGDPQALIVASQFHAHPFQDPFTGKNYVRARWFDTQTGTWLTADPAGYQDSSNLYAYCGNDPVNCSDATGEDGWSDARAVLRGAGRTLLTAAKVTVVAAAVIVVTGVSAPVVVAVGATVAVGMAAHSAVQHHRAGHSVLASAALGVGDVTGGTAIYEAVRGKDADTGTRLTRDQRLERVGSGGVGLVLTATAIKGGVSAVRSGRGAGAGAAAVQETTGARPPTARAPANVAAESRVPRSSPPRAPRSQPAEEFINDNAVNAAEPAPPSPTIASPEEAFHYTSAQAAESITQQGLRPGSYATPSGELSPLQAQLELALPPNRALPNARIRIDLAGMRRAGFKIPAVTRVSNVVRGAGGRVYSMPGGGYQLQFPYQIPPEFITIVR